MSDRKEDEKSGSTLGRLFGAALGVAAVVGTVAYGVASLVSSSSEEKEEEKMMRAPGRPGEYILRDQFAENHKKYFSDLREDKKSRKNLVGVSHGNYEEDKTEAVKMMRAPGRPGEYIPRNEFAENPKDYFSDLRKKW